MSFTRNIRIMISSRCNDLFPLSGEGAQVLSKTRLKLKSMIEGEKLLGRNLFDVWINEDSPPQEGSSDSWEVCLQAVKDCDILLVLDNGNAGWAKTGSDIGICHAELLTAMSAAPEKVFIVCLGSAVADNSDQGKRNARFQAYVSQLNLFRGTVAGTISDLEKRVLEVLHEAVVKLAQKGVRELKKGRAYSGQALEWNRMDYLHRQRAIIDVLNDALSSHKSSPHGEHAFVSLASFATLFLVNSIPAAISISRAREMVGQPFLRDFQFAGLLKKNQGGPVHLIGCHRGITESQALKLLGFPDATIVSTPFGVFVADNVQKTQLVFIADCCDESSTRHGVQRFFEWLHQSGEEELLALRAMSRTRIIRSIAKENQAS